MTPSTHPGLLGICLSGAGPTILALVSKEDGSPGAGGTVSTDVSDITLGSTSGATGSEASPKMQAIGEAIKTLWKEEGINVDWLALEVDREGATLTEVN